MKTDKAVGEFLVIIKFVIRQTINVHCSRASEKLGLTKVALTRITRQNRGVNLDWGKLCAIALLEIEATLASLPEPLRVRVEKLPVIFERQPNTELQADGIEADTLGLFTGASFVEENDVPLPPQIILFLENIGDVAETNEKLFREEVRTTFLHELGHYLGLDEDELADRGLE
jgi:predicted Zn-dependent protease with MMP-like domain